MIVQVTNLDHKWLNAEIIPVNDKSCEYDCVIRDYTNAAGPHLCRSNGRRMNYDLVFFFVKSRSRLKACNVRPVAHFCLDI
jgi:hypothetical protein